jgi:hypothetical protein
VLAISFAALFAVLQLYLISSRSTSLEAHRRVVDALVEGDGIITRNYDDLHTRAESVEPGEDLALKDWPVPVALTRDEVLNSTPESLRRLLLDRSARRLYDDGAGSALRANDASGDPGRLSAAGVVRSFLDLMRDDVHTASAIVLLILAVVTLGLAGVVVTLTRGYGRLIAIGVAAAAGALPALLAGLALNAYMRISSDSGTEYLRHALLNVGRDLTMMAVRTGVAIALAAVVVAALGALAARWSDARGTATAGSPRVA